MINKTLIRKWVQGNLSFYKRKYKSIYQIDYWIRCCSIQICVHRTICKWQAFLKSLSIHCIGLCRLLNIHKVCILGLNTDRKQSIPDRKYGHYIILYLVFTFDNFQLSVRLVFQLKLIVFYYTYVFVFYFLFLKPESKLTYIYNYTQLAEVSIDYALTTSNTKSFFLSFYFFFLILIYITRYL